jgi:LysM repeat protein
MKRTRWAILILLALLLVLTSTAWAAPAGAAAKKACGNCWYRVKRGDTLYSIARRHGTSVRLLRRCNAIRNANWIHVGWKLRVPCTAMPKPPRKPPRKPPVKPPDRHARNCRLLYVVESGDTLSGVAEHTCSTVAAIATRNHIPNPNHIYTGQRLCIPIRPYWCR